MLDFLIQRAYAEGLPAATTGGTSFDVLFSKIITNVANPVIRLLLVLAVVIFVWGVMQFIRNADNVEKRAAGYQHIIWGIIGIFIMVASIGIVNIIRSIIGS